MMIFSNPPFFLTRKKKQPNNDNIPYVLNNRDYLYKDQMFSTFAEVSRS